MTYLVIPEGQPPFLTEWFEKGSLEPECPYVCIDIFSLKYTDNTINYWEDITEDHL